MQAIVQLRGEVNVNEGVVDTLDMLNVGRVNHATFVPETDSYRGMITKVNDLVAFGEPSVETVAATIERRGEPLEGDADVDDAWVAENTDYDDVAALAEAIVAEETTLREQGVSPTLRLHAPRGGHDGIKHPIVEGGELGRHSTEEMDALLEAMR
ncbi:MULTISPECIES: 50S ribosomal protein L30 [Halorubrum]|uniref:Large ribosomal subunit protein uL30 n=1 Tax=Halorubrum halodurans TaxID=1383851 RepID=A0A256ILP5_9EURY|nr:MULTISPECIES: 50S ribosomal protein L30 [Halorubrum]OYR57488.1 50S ribosomal protein L30 [Halorubrum halodurans]